MTGQPFVWAARDAAVRGRVLVMVRKLCVQWVPFVHRCACATASRCPSRRGAEAAPYDFLRSAPAPRGPTELSPSASAAAIRVHATRPPAGPRIEMQGLHHCTERTARRAQPQQSSIGERIAAPASNRAARRRRAREPCGHHPALAMRRCSSLSQAPTPRRPPTSPRRPTGGRPPSSLH